MPSSTLTRRLLLGSAGVVAIGTATLAMGPEEADAAAPASGPYFRHGVASGDPLPDGVLLWTRVTPDAVSLPGSGRGPNVTVTWEVATDATFARVVAKGTVATGAARDHTVKAEPRGLAPATTYFYRFRVNRNVSPIGRTRTAPAPGAAVTGLRFGVVSCANLQAGFFSPYRHLAARGDLDLVLHLGDYLYEYAPGEYQARDVVVRPHDPPTEMVVLQDYRRRHAQYKSDTDLQALHAAAPFVVTWDDHEFANDAWSGGAENHTETTEGSWDARRAASQQAYSEWMPVRYTSGGILYRRLQFGSLASISMLDLRTYRSQQAPSVVDQGISSPDRTITGDAQLAWLLDGLTAGVAQWKLIGNPVMITPIRFPSTLNSGEIGAMHELLGTTTIDGVPYNVDQWDGYTADRGEVLKHLRDNAVTDTVFLTGDIHSGWACDVPADPLTYPTNGASVATELVCTSVTSDNLDDILRVPPRTGSLAVETAFRASNPHVKYLDFDTHGYSVLNVTPAGLRMDWYAISDRTVRAATSAVTASWQVIAGTQRVTAAVGAAQ
ncbi:alkaline phosphatase D [Marisediminicola sp. UYEF4]|uniref:alkaline phosphatase D family protein n=1 Tax=Marisediminicola sp. UYEF4 TaxID=1756384 RepID=UPI0033940239